MSLRSRSESPLPDCFDDDLSQHAAGRPELFSAIAARKRAEQDALLLANRIRLLRAEEDKTKKRVQETEKKTQEVMAVRRRNEEQRALREVERSQREARELDARERQCRAREEQQRKRSAVQKTVTEHKLGLSNAVKREREEAKLFLQEQRAQTDAEQQARAERVRSIKAAAARSRARSEGTRHTNVKSDIQERLRAEEEQRLARLADIERMEREEAELLARLQKTQEKHRDAFLRLEDTVATRATPSSSSRSSPVPVTPQGVFLRGGGPELQLPTLGSGSTVGAAARPPLPRGATLARQQSPCFAAGKAVVRKRPGSASRAAVRSASTPTYAARAASSCSMKGGIGEGTQVGCSRSGSSCSTTASGGCHGAEPGESSRSSTPSTAQKQQAVTYTTVDGLTLDVAQEEDLDLAALLNGT